MSVRKPAQNRLSPGNGRKSIKYRKYRKFFPSFYSYRGGTFFFCDELAISQTIFVELGVFPILKKKKKKGTLRVSDPYISEWSIKN